MYNFVASASSKNMFHSFKIYTLKTSVKKLLDETQHDEDYILQEIYFTSKDVYKKVVEIVALHYCGVITGSEILYERIIFEMGRDVLHIIKLLATYIPTLWSNQKISRKVKYKKIFYATCVLGMLIWWIKNLYYYQYESQIRYKNDLEDNVSAIRTVAYDTRVRPAMPANWLYDRR